MRVPIYPDDLLPQAAFKKLAKSIQNRWLGQAPIQLSRARDILSRGLGYADYSELRHFSLTSSLEAPTPSESAVRTRIAAALISALESTNDRSVTHSTLEVFVEALPLKALTTFKMAASGVTPSVSSKRTKLDLTKGHVSPVNLTCPEKPLPTYTASMIRVRKSKPPESPLKTISQDEVDAIKRAVERSGNLRDLSIFSMLEWGLRGHAFLGTKVSQIGNIAPLPLNVMIIQSKSPTLVGTADVIGRYIASENLSPGDYLFPSKSDPKKPMSSRELLQIFRSWEKDAPLPHAQRKLQSLRNAFVDRYMLKGSLPLSSLDLVTKQTGHNAQRTTSHYMVLDDNYLSTAINGKPAKK